MTYQLFLSLRKHSLLGYELDFVYQQTKTWSFYFLPEGTVTASDTNNKTCDLMRETKIFKWLECSCNRLCIGGGVAEVTLLSRFKFELQLFSWFLGIKRL
jgi:hypothetical protein